MEKLKRSYYLPGKMVAAFDREAEKQGYVREKVVAAAVLHFMESGPGARSEMFERMDAFMRSKKG